MYHYQSFKWLASQYVFHAETLNRQLGKGVIRDESGRVKGQDVFFGSDMGQVYLPDFKCEYQLSVCCSSCDITQAGTHKCSQGWFTCLVHISIFSIGLTRTTVPMRTIPHQIKIKPNHCPAQNHISAGIKSAWPDDNHLPLGPLHNKTTHSGTKPVQVWNCPPGQLSRTTSRSP